MFLPLSKKKSESIVKFCNKSRFIKQPWNYLFCKLETFLNRKSCLFSCIYLFVFVSWNFGSSLSVFLYLEQPNQRTNFCWWLLFPKILASNLQQQYTFCFENCSDLLWEKNVFSDQEKLIKIIFLNRGTSEYVFISRSNILEHLKC